MNWWGVPRKRQADTVTRTFPLWEGRSLVEQPKGNAVGRGDAAYETCQIGRWKEHQESGRKDAQSNETIHTDTCCTTERRGFTNDGRTTTTSYKGVVCPPAVSCYRQIGV